MNKLHQPCLKIMIVDDHAGFRELMRSYFPPPRFEVTECAGGSGALAEYRRFRPDWVLMDCEMKDLDGMAATRRIRAEFPEARVLIVTEHPDATLSAAAAAAGARGLIAKDNLAEVRRFLTDIGGHSADKTA